MALKSSLDMTARFSDFARSFSDEGARDFDRLRALHSGRGRLRPLCSCFLRPGLSDHVSPAVADHSLVPCRRWLDHRLFMLALSKLVAVITGPIFHLVRGSRCRDIISHCLLCLLVCIRDRGNGFLDLLSRQSCAAEVADPAKAKRFRWKD